MMAEFASITGLVAAATDFSPESLGLPVPEPPRGAARDATAPLAAGLRYLAEASRNDGLVERSLARVYEERGFRPLWVTPEALGDSGRRLLRQLARAAREGWHSEGLALAEIGHLHRLALGPNARDRQALAALEWSLSKAYAAYARGLVEGRVPAPERDSWHYPFQPFEPAALFRDLDELGPDGILESLERHERLPPAHQAEALRVSLSAYRRIAEAGGWPQLDPGEPLAAGDRGERVRTLRRRLAATGDVSGSGDSDQYDAELEEGVRRFQARHGLEPDGRVGRRTLEAMNVPVAERIQQIEINLERGRWLPPIETDELIWINIPEFRLRAFRGGREALDMPVVVGTPETPTPTFYETVQYAVLNPDWIVPESIALREVLPKAQEDPGYLLRAEFELLDDAGSAMSLDDLQVDLLRSGRHRIRRKPGPWNDLGRIKFMFPNEFQIYLHDTPARSLFLRASRAFSHGCVRVGDPLELARFLFGPRFDQLRVELEAGVHREMGVEKPVPVYIVYFTAWRDSDGTVHFRDDVYGRDLALASELSAERSPIAGGADAPLLWPSVD